MSESILIPRESPTRYRGFTTKELAKALWNAELPEEAVRSLPAQALYMVIKESGFSSSTDLLMMVTLEQCRTFLDLDLWQDDLLCEDTFWEWLSITDAVNDLSLLQKFLKVVDLKLVAIFISRYVDAKIFDQQNENPPGAGYHTPDHGFTWIGFPNLDGEKHFLMGRFLALIFETSKELFYQLLATPGIATESMLQEDAYQERQKRLASEGIPEAEVAATIHAPYSLAQAIKDLKERVTHMVAPDQVIVEPLLYESRPHKHLADLIGEVSNRELLEGELTWLMNGAIVFFGVDFTDQDKVFLLAEQVKGAINIGIEKVITTESYNLKQLYEVLGLTKLYQLGLTFIKDLGKKALRVDLEKIKDHVEDRKVFSTLAALREKFPGMPVFLSDTGEIEGDSEKLEQGVRAIETIKALELLNSIVARAAG